MTLNRWTLSLESLGERIVPDAAPITLAPAPVAADTTPISIPPQPDPQIPLPVIPAPEVAPNPRPHPFTPEEIQQQFNAALFGVLEAYLKNVQQQLRDVENQIFNQKLLLQSMDRTDPGRVGVEVQYLAELLIKREQLRQLYKQQYDVYKDFAQERGHTIPSDISSFDPKTVGVTA